MMTALAATPAIAVAGGILASMVLSLVVMPAVHDSIARRD